MSAETERWAKKQCLGTDLSSRARLVLQALSWRVNRKDKECCYPRIRTIMNDTGLGRTSVHLALAELERRCLVQRYMTSQQQGNVASTYLLNVNELASAAWLAHCVDLERSSRKGVMLGHLRLSPVHLRLLSSG